MERTKGLLVVFPFNLLSVSVVWSCFDFLSIFPLLPWAVACPLPWGSNNSPPHCWVAEQTSTLSLRSWKPALSSLLLALFSGVAQLGSAFLENNSELCSAKALFLKLWCLLTGSPLSTPAVPNCWPLLMWLAASAVPALLGRQPQGAEADAGQALLLVALACGLSPWLDHSESVCVSTFETSGLKSRTSNEQSTSTTAWSCFIFFMLPIAYRIVRIKKKKSKLRAMQVKEKRKGLFSELLNLETPPDSAS